MTLKRQASKYVKIFAVHTYGKGLICRIIKDSYKSVRQKNRKWVLKNSTAILKRGYPNS